MQSGFIKAGLWVSLALLNMIVIHFHFWSDRRALSKCKEHFGSCSLLTMRMGLHVVPACLEDISFFLLYDYKDSVERRSSLLILTACVRNTSRMLSCKGRFCWQWTLWLPWKQGCDQSSIQFSATRLIRYLNDWAVG
jgi:hypothetical protein